jgi:hypothetical protein
MSYDLIFWRGKTEGAPADVYQRLNRQEHIEGVAELSFEDVQTAFRAEFPDLQEEGEELLGPGFSVMLYVRPIRLVAVCCAWGVLKRPEILEKIERAGFSGLKCHRYNPQVDEFKENAEALA